MTSKPEFSNSGTIPIFENPQRNDRAAVDTPHLDVMMVLATLAERWEWIPGQPDQLLLKMTTLKSTSPPAPIV